MTHSRRSRRTTSVAIATAVLAAVVLVAAGVASIGRTNADDVVPGLAAGGPVAVVTATGPTSEPASAPAGTTPPTVSAGGGSGSRAAKAAAGTGKRTKSEPSHSAPHPGAGGLSTVSTAAVSYLPGVAVSAPETYRVVGDVLGWQDRSAGIVCVRVVDAQLLGPVDPITGREKNKPAAKAANHAAALRTLTILAATAPGARASLSPGVTELNVVLFPGTGGSTFVLDRVVD